MTVETGHFVNRIYVGALDGNLHLNGAVIDCNDTGAVFAVTPVQTLAAAGTNQGNAAAITAPTVKVTGASGTNGVILPTPTVVGQEVTVINTNGSNALLVYPDSGGTGGTIGNGAANASASLAAAKGATYVCTALSPTAWWSASN